MNILNKLLIPAVFAVLALQVMPVSVHAETANPFSYTLNNDGTAELICLDKTIETADIPAEIDGHKITALSAKCFADCISLKTITIPETVTALEDYAFYGCSALEEIYIPAGVTEIGSYVFEATEAMTSFQVDEANPSYQSPDGVLYDKAGATLIKYPEAKADKAYAVLDSCQVIADWAFIGAQYLEQADLKQVSTIGEDAFCWCVSLKNITVPEGVTDLHGAVFSYCRNLEQVTLPSGLLSVGERCFYSCTSLQSVNLPDGLQKIGEYAFCHCTALPSLTVPKSVTTVTIDCMGYCYDEENDTYLLQDNFTLYVYEKSAAWKYAATNHIHYEIIRTEIVYYILIAVLCVMIIILSTAIIRILKNRRNNT